jgi:hypothetical protein
MEDFTKTLQAQPPILSSHHRNRLCRAQNLAEDDQMLVNHNQLPGYDNQFLVNDNQILVNDNQFLVNDNQIPG